MHMHMHMIVDNAFSCSVIRTHSPLGNLEHPQTSINPKPVEITEQASLDISRYSHRNSYYTKMHTVCASSRPLVVGVIDFDVVVSKVISGCFVLTIALHISCSSCCLFPEGLGALEDARVSSAAECELSTGSTICRHVQV
jgi:hypothetical protein